jgi:hypothetical protein
MQSPEHYRMISNLKPALVGVNLSFHENLSIEMTLLEVGRCKAILSANLAEINEQEAKGVNYPMGQDGQPQVSPAV